MERHRTMRAYSAGGVVFRLVPQRSTEDSHTTDKQSDVRDKRDEYIKVVIVELSHAVIWVLPKGTPEPGDTIEQVAVHEVQEETGLKARLISYIGSITYSF